MFWKEKLGMLFFRFVFVYVYFLYKFYFICLVGVYIFGYWNFGKNIYIYILEYV